VSHQPVEEYAVKSLFDDDTFSFETLRGTGFANHFGADLGPVRLARHHTDRLRSLIT